MRKRYAKMAVDAIPEAAPAENLYARTVQGSFWQLLNAGGQKVLQIGIFFILARLLTPTDYGVLAVIFIVIGFFNQLTDIPFGTTLIQKKGDVERYLDAYWTLEIVRALFNAFLIVMFGGLIATWFKVEDHALLIRLSGILLVIPTFSNARLILTFRKMDFRIIAIRDLLTQIAFGVVTLAYVFLIGHSPAALVMGYAAMYALGVFLSYVLVPGVIRVSFAFRKLSDLAGQAGWLYGQDLVVYASQYLDKIVLGLLLTPNDLGLYSKAKDLSSSPAGFIVSIARKVGLSAFALVQDSRVKIREGMIRSFDILFLTVIPASILFLLEGGTVIRVLLGDTWLSIVMPFKIMAIGSIFFAVIHIINTTVIAVGRPDAGFKANLIQTIITLPLSWLGVRLAGIQGLAYATFAVWFLLAAYLFIRLRETIQVKATDGVRYAIITIVTTATLTVIELGIGPFLHRLNRLEIDALWVGALGLFYFAILYAIARFVPQSPWHTGRSLLTHLLPKR
jgi:O-antigen/teichoic acid export membrane protein